MARNKAPTAERAPGPLPGEWVFRKIPHFRYCTQNRSIVGLDRDKRVLPTGEIPLPDILNAIGTFEPDATWVDIWTEAYKIGADWSRRYIRCSPRLDAHDRYYDWCWVEFAPGAGLCPAKVLALCRDNEGSMSAVVNSLDWPKNAMIKERTLLTSQWKLEFTTTGHAKLRKVSLASF
jgi:hypothetical protein